MKKIVPLVAGSCILMALICAVLIFQSNWSFSFLFKTMLLMVSASIGTIAYWKTNYKIFPLIVSILAFASLAIILGNAVWYNTFWNVVLCLHIILIALTLVAETDVSPSVRLKLITRVMVVITMSLFAIIVLGKLQIEWLTNTTFALILIMSTLLLINKFTFLFKR